VDAEIVFTTEKTARLLGLPEWRIVRFAQMKVFGIKPAFADAEGPGSRRLYNLENVCEFALASWLLQAGLRTEVIGRVLTNVRSKGGLSHLLSESHSEVKGYYLALSRTPKGRIARQNVLELRSWPQLEKIFRQEMDASLLVIPVGLRLLALAERLGRKGD